MAVWFHVDADQVLNMYSTLDAAAIRAGSSDIYILSILFAQRALITVWKSQRAALW